MARRDLRQLSASVRQQVAATIDSLVLDPKPADSKLLKGTLAGLRSVRVAAAWRIAYEVDDDAQTVTVWAIGHRRNVYDRVARRR
jgi:mRNA interferase RelE/StbE